MDNLGTKPKLVFFQHKYDEHLPTFVLNHKREHVRCLSQFFEVTLIQQDCDYQEICDQYEPDLTLFESGVPFTCRRPQIINTATCGQIPKLGLLHSDAFSEQRAGFLSDMDQWGIETFFAIATTAAEHTPEIADNLFIWPNGVDADIYHDYGQWKSIPVLFAGNSNALYPWRQAIMKRVSKHYPSLICPHPGYDARNVVMQVIVGEPYARMLNASWFVPACGTVAKEVVRKHFEIPACKACLVTEQSPALEAAGFIDMKNCVFAHEQNILDKLAYLFQHREELEAIADVGYQLAHSRHTSKHRDQILQWFNLQKLLQSNQKIVQAGPFGPLRIVETSLRPANAHIISNGLLLALLRQGDEKLGQGNYEEAENAYLRALNYYRWMPEPQLRLAVCNLYKGNARRALSWVFRPLQFTLAQYKAIDPDPVEWAYFIVSLLCLGKVDDAVKRSGQFPWLRHPVLDRARCAASVLKNHRRANPLPPHDALKYRFTIHQLPSRTFREWIHDLYVMLRACGRGDFAETLMRCCSQELLQAKQCSAGAHRETPAKEEGDLYKNWLRKSPLSFGRKDASGLFERQLIYDRLRERMRRTLRHVLHRLEAKYGYFLPYRLSESKNDEFFRAIRDLTRYENIKAALIVGAAAGKASTEAFLAGALENKNKPSAFCVSRSRLYKRAFPNSPAVKWYSLAPSFPDNFSEELGKTVRKIKEENQLNFFDVLLIDGSQLTHHLAPGTLSNGLYGARFICLDDVNGVCNQGNYGELLEDPDYVLVDHNPGLRNGYAIFEKKSAADCEIGNALCSGFMLAE